MKILPRWSKRFYLYVWLVQDDVNLEITIQHINEDKHLGICCSIFKQLNNGREQTQSMPGDTCDRTCTCSHTRKIPSMSEKMRNHCQTWHCTCQKGTSLSPLQHWWVSLSSHKLQELIMNSKWKLKVGRDLNLLVAFVYSFSFYTVQFSFHSN